MSKIPYDALAISWRHVVVAVLCEERGHQACLIYIPCAELDWDTLELKPVRVEAALALDSGPDESRAFQDEGLKYLHSDELYLINHQQH